MQFCLRWLNDSKAKYKIPSTKIPFICFIWSNIVISFSVHKMDDLALCYRKDDLLWRINLSFWKVLLGKHWWWIFYRLKKQLKYILFLLYLKCIYHTCLEGFISVTFEYMNAFFFFFCGWCPVMAIYSLDVNTFLLCFPESTSISLRKVSHQMCSSVSDSLRDFIDFRLWDSSPWLFCQLLAETRGSDAVVGQVAFNGHLKQSDQIVHAVGG